MSWITPVTDHVDGEAYEYEDMNRVGSDIRYIADKLIFYGYAVTVAPKIDWMQGEIPTPAQMSQYITDLTTIKNKFYGTKPLPTSMDDFSEIEANNIETMLIEVEEHLTRMAAAFRYCGELICGEDQ